MMSLLRMTGVMRMRGTIRSEDVGRRLQRFFSQKKEQHSRANIAVEHRPITNAMDADSPPTSLRLFNLSIGHCFPDVTGTFFSSGLANEKGYSS